MQRCVYQYFILVVHLACLNSYKETHYLMPYNRVELYIVFHMVYITFMYNCKCEFIGLRRLAFVDVKVIQFS